MEQQSIITSVKVVGAGFTGAQWIAYFESLKYKIQPFLKDILASPDYDAHHRLEAGKEYTFSLFNGKPFDPSLSGESNTAEAFTLKGEFALLLYQKLTYGELKNKGLWGVDVPHIPIDNFHNRPALLYVSRYKGILHIFACSADRYRSSRFRSEGRRAFAQIAA